MKKQFTLIALAFLLIVVTTTCKKDVHVTGIKLNEQSLTLEVGDTATLVATIFPENATNQLVTFISSNPLVAAVTSNGLVIAISKGITIIEVTTIDGNLSAKCTVQVEECFVIEATDVQFSTDDIATAYASVYGKDDEKVLVSTEYQDNSFKLELPRAVDDKYLHLFLDYRVTFDLFEDFDENWVSDKNAEIAFVSVSAWDEDQNFIGNFYHVSGDYFDHSFAREYFIYADRNFTVKGEKIDKWGTLFKYDCSFSKGWNLLYIYSESEIVTTYCLLTTEKPLGGSWDWFYQKWLIGEKSPDNKHSFGRDMIVSPQLLKH